MNKIRKLTGKHAQEYVKILESEHVFQEMFLPSILMLELRARFMEFMNLELKYFHKRHRYTSEHRRLLDFFVINTYDNKYDDRLAESGLLTEMRIKHLKFIYRKELYKKHDWIRVTASDAKNQIFVWHEDIDKYFNQN